MEGFDEYYNEAVEPGKRERRFYQKITDIYATSMDYDKDAEETRLFLVA